MYSSIYSEFNIKNTGIRYYDNFLSTLLRFPGFIQLFLKRQENMVLSGQNKLLDKILLLVYL